MLPRINKRVLYLSLCQILLVGNWLLAQSGGAIEGHVRLDKTGAALHGISVLIVQLSRTVETDQEGYYRFDDVPAGQYDLLAHSGALNSDTQLVEVRAGETAALDFVLRINPLQQEITVTASGVEETAFEAVQSVTSVDSYALAQKMATSLGDALDGEAGVSKRSFGPGTARPVIRGFDGDRVLIMQDGTRVGTLGSQSGDHGEPIDPASLERVEIIKGPATLLYGSNAIGGVVNAISAHSGHDRPHQGPTGQLTGVGGTTNAQGGASGHFEYGHQGWLFWGGGGGQRTADYDTPIGRIRNSKSRVSSLDTGLGYYGERGYLSFGYDFNDSRYGIPGADQLEEDVDKIDIAMRRRSYRFNGGLKRLGPAFDNFDFSLDYIDYNHDEIEFATDGTQDVGTAFKNRQWVYRGVFEQARGGGLEGRFGFWGLARNYDVSGEEALSPPVDQTAFAVFGLEELNFERAKLQFGGRVELNNYNVRGLSFREPDGGGDPVGVQLPDRNFSAVSAGIGGRFDVGSHGAFVANFTSSYRAPALEELYNFGPHGGNLAFEIGNPELGGERSNGIEFSFRQHQERIHANASFFYYHINNFIFLQHTGAIEDGLLEGEYLQGDSRFVGAEFRVDPQLLDTLWLNLGLDFVDAELTANHQALPRIPPLKGRMGLEFRRRGLSVRPELVVADNRRGDQLAPNETPTAGYTVVNLKAAYTIPAQHLLHQFSVDVFNIGDRLYRNHLSFIKDFAPEMGRGVRFSYTVKLF